MSKLPYNYNVRLLFESQVGLRVHWCGRYPHPAEWLMESSRLASDMILFIFIEKHECWIVVNGRRFVLREGDLLIIRGGDEFSSGSIPSRFQRRLVSLSISLALEKGSISNLLLQRKFDRRYRLKNPEEYISKFEAILQALESPLNYREMAITGALLQWMANILAETKALLDHSPEIGQNVVEKVLASQTWASTRLESVITLNEWAKAVHLHPVYFERIFKRETGVTPMRWLEERRMNVARQYLSGTSKNVTEIAEAVGYLDPFYFSRVFRKHFGKSPVNYRKTGIEMVRFRSADPSR